MNEFYGSHAKIATVQQYDKVVLPENFGQGGIERIFDWLPGLGYKDSVAILKPIGYDKVKIEGEYK